MSESSERSLGPPDPLNAPPRSDMAPNANEPVGSVGPNVPTAEDPSGWHEPGGFGASNVMYPEGSLSAVPWSGWPVSWDVPSNLNSAFGLGQAGQTDIVFACLDLNSRIFASLPVYQAKKGIPTAPRSWIYNPNPLVYNSFREFAKQVWISTQACGEAFIVATSRFEDGRPRTFVVMPPAYVNVDMIGGQRSYSIGGIDATEDILHIRYQSTLDGDGHGVGPLAVAGARISAAKALMRYGADLANNGGVPWAVLSTKYKLGAAQAELIRQQWVIAARRRAGAPAIIDQDMTLSPLQVTPRDMGLSELQSFSEARITVLLGLPPFMLGLPSGADSMTYSNVTSLLDQHYRTTILTIGGDIYAALSGWLLPGHVDLKMNADQYVRPGWIERSQYYEAMSRMGAMTVDEIRRAEGLAPMGTLETTAEDLGLLSTDDVDSAP